MLKLKRLNKQKQNKHILPFCLKSFSKRRYTTLVHTKSNDGITLIALIITIIVLLILAGATLSLTLGKNGLLKRAQFAKDKYKNAINEEETELEQITNYLLNNHIENGNNIEKLTASMFSFTPENSEWIVKDVKEALDYLYTQ